MIHRAAFLSLAALLAGAAFAQSPSAPSSQTPTSGSTTQTSPTSGSTTRPSTTSGPTTTSSSSGATPTRTAASGGSTTSGSSSTSKSGTSSGSSGTPAVGVVGLDVSPASLQVGQDATITVTVRNVGAAPATFSTTLTWDGPSLGPEDRRADLPPGQNHSFSRTWRAVAGRHLFIAKADPDNRLREPEAARADNTRSLVVEVAPRLVVRTIVYRVAEDAGALFPAPALQGGNTCSARTGPAENGGVAVELRCPSFTGTSTTHRAYVSFRLRNGWKVKATNVEVRENRSGGYDVVKPATGSDRPETTIHLRSGPFGAIRLVVTTVLTGPEGTEYDR